MRKQRDNCSLSRIGAKESQSWTSGGYDLLLLRARELAQHSLGDICRRLHRQGVEEHVGSGRHLDSWGVNSPRDIRLELEGELGVWGDDVFIYIR